MSGNWHQGELQLQRMAGVSNSAGMRQGIRDQIPPVAASFLAEQLMAILATIDDDGWPRASIATGPRGFLQAPDPQTLWVGAEARIEPAARARLQGGAPIGLLIIDLATRRRMRLSGQAITWPGGGHAIRVQEVFSNCPKYIQVRELAPPRESGAPAPAESETRGELAASDRTALAKADTLFIATHHPDAGADASHRGGQPGFVRVNSPGSITLPDYQGNLMFQTLGNLLVDDRVALLVPDFQSGDTLHIAGHATLETESPSLGEFPGAERLVHIEIECVEATRDSLGLRGELKEISPFNPAPASTQGQTR